MALPPGTRLSHFEVLALRLLEKAPADRPSAEALVAELSALDGRVQAPRETADSCP